MRGFAVLSRGSAKRSLRRCCWSDKQTGVGVGCGPGAEQCLRSGLGCSVEASVTGRWGAAARERTWREMSVSRSLGLFCVRTDRTEAGRPEWELCIDSSRRRERLRPGGR